VRRFLSSLPRSFRSWYVSILPTPVLALCCRWCPCSLGPALARLTPPLAMLHHTTFPRPHVHVHGSPCSLIPHAFRGPRSWVSLSLFLSCFPLPTLWRPRPALSSRPALLALFLFCPSPAFSRLLLHPDAPFLPSTRWVPLPRS